MLCSECSHSADHPAWKSSGTTLSQQQELKVASWLPSSSRDACSGCMEGVSGKRLTNDVAEDLKQGVSVDSL